MPTQTIQVNYIPHPAQRIIHEDPHRFRVAVCGRRFGKDTLAVQEALHYLGKPRAKVWWLAPAWSNVLQSWSKFMEEVPEQLIREVNKVERRINMINSSRIWFKSADDPKSLEGEGLDFVILNECGRMREKIWEESIRPTLGDKERIGDALFIGTPKGLNWFYKIYLLGKIVKPGHSWKSFQYPSWKKPRSMWRLDEEGKADWERAKESLPTRIFQQEYGAKFLEDLGTIFRFVDKAVKGDLEPYVNTEIYTMGVDFGKVNSWTVSCILNSSGHLVGFDRFKSTDWNLGVDRVVAFAETYHANVICDATGLGDPLLDFIKRRYDKTVGLKIKSNKMALIDNLAIQIEKGAREDVEGGVTYPDIEQLTTELKVFGTETKEGMPPKYKAPAGFTDDCVIALALSAWHMYKGQVELSHTWMKW